MGRRYEQVTDDDNSNDEDIRYRTKARGGRFDGGGGGGGGGGFNGRYEVTRPSLKDQQQRMQGKRIKIYTNGPERQRDRCLTMAFKWWKHTDWGKFLDQIHDDKMPINDCPVRFLFKWPSGEEVFSTAQIADEDDTRVVYVCSGKRDLHRRGRYAGMDFGSSLDGSSFNNKQSRNSHDSRGTNRSQKQSPTSFRSNGPMSHGTRGPKNITVVCNKNRQKMQSLFIDPQGVLPFEEILRCVTEMLEMDSPCEALYSYNHPHKKVDSMSSLKRMHIASGDKFLACGCEGPPSSSKSRDGSPLRNGYHGKQRNGGRQNGFDDRGKQSHDMKQSNGFEDSQGREFQRHHDNDRDNDESPPSEYPQHQDDRLNRDDNSPQRRENGRDDHSPQRKDSRRDQENQSTQRRDNRRDQGKSPPERRDNRREREENKRRDDDRDDRRERDQQNRKSKQETPRETDDRRGNGRSEPDSDDDDVSRGKTPSEHEIAERVEDMAEVNSNRLDKDIEY